MTSKKKEIKEMQFKKNFNYKLYCECFTTIRLHYGQYQVGQVVKVMNGNTFFGTAKILDIKTFHLDKLPSITSFVDMGVDAETGRKILTQMYTYDLVQHYESKFAILLLKYEQRERVASPWLVAL